jgi:hypothetical protein
MTNKTKRLKRSVIWKIPKEQLQTILNNSNSYKEVLISINMNSSCGNYKTLNEAIREYNLDLSNIINNRKNQPSVSRKISIPDEIVFVENSKYNNREMLKKRLLGLGVEYICVECGVSDNYNNKPISLQLDHINGINDDNRIKNLRFLCPNCHSQTDTFSGKIHRKINRCSCGSIISNKANYCYMCRPTKPPKIIWPSKSIMEKLLWICL